MFATKKDVVFVFVFPSQKFLFLYFQSFLFLQNFLPPRESGVGELLAWTGEYFVFVFVVVFVFSLSRVFVFVFPDLFVTRRVAVERGSSLLGQSSANLLCFISFHKQ